MLVAHQRAPGIFGVAVRTGQAMAGLIERVGPATCQAQAVSQNGSQAPGPPGSVSVAGSLWQCGIRHLVKLARACRQPDSL